ncbi:MAG: tetratricopeptide repeat protein [Cyanobacteria bacterium P01_D01_bin.36]
MRPFLSTSLSILMLFGTPAITQAQSIETLIQQGTVARESQDYAEGERIFREVLELDPNYAPAHVELGFALWNQGQSEEAEGAFREALRLDPDNAKALTNLVQRQHLVVGLDRIVGRRGVGGRE